MNKSNRRKGSKQDKLKKKNYVRKEKKYDSSDDGSGPSELFSNLNLDHSDHESGMDDYFFFCSISNSHIH